VAEKAEAALSPTPKLEVLHLEIDRETDGRWIAEWTHSPGVMAYGKTKQEAIECATKLLAEAELALSKTPPTHRTWTQYKAEEVNEYEDRIADLCTKVKMLLDWLPICSEGSSGYLRRIAVETAMAELVERASPSPKK
jgi:hypothetical protein